MLDLVMNAGRRYLLPAPSAGHGAIIIIILLVLIVFEAGLYNSEFPPFLEIGLGDALDQATYWLAESLRSVFRPVSSAISYALKQIDGFFLALPWPILILGAFLGALRLNGPRFALLATASVILIGGLGLMEPSIKTLSLMALSIFFTLLFGIPLGVLASRNDRMDAVLRPVLDAMQTLPTFVYLVPVMLLFGLGAPSAVIATIIYAAPPVIRLTNSGIRQIPVETVEVARVFGSSYFQTLFKVLLPQAKPSIMVGINQTVMMALAMVVFVALIGAAGLGKEILVFMRRLQVGLSLEAGLAIVLIAICLDRISQALAVRGDKTLTEKNNWRWMRLVLGLVLLVILALVNSFLFDFGDWPKWLRFSFAQPIDDAVGWINLNLSSVTNAIRGFVFAVGLGPWNKFFFWVPWPVLILVTTYLAYFVAGWRISVLTLVGWIFIGVTGMWEPTMMTLSQLFVGLFLSITIAFPLGIMAAHNDRLDMLLRPVLDFMQTLPVFVYLPVVIMLFKIGDISGTIITAIYAIPPAVRLTNLGLRQVPNSTIEAARSCGSTPLQILIKIKLPLAMPSIMMGVNQTIMMCLAMVVYTALIGARGLGAEVLLAIGRFDVGLGIEAGMSIVFIAVVIDRLTKGWVTKRQLSLGIRQ